MAFGPRHAYLTHFSQIPVNDRVAQDLHDSIDSYVDIAKANRDSNDRYDAIKSALFENYIEGLGKLDFEGSRDDAWTALHFDLHINTMGLEVWLDRNPSG